MGATRLSGAFIEFPEIPTPSNPATDVGKLYCKDLGSVTTLFFRDDVGVETDLLAGGGGEVNTSSNVGGGEGLAIAKVGVDLPFKSLLGGTNITLSSTGTEITIDSTAGGGSPLTTKGDIFGFTTIDARIPVGANNLVLMADSGEALGVKYALIINANIDSSAAIVFTKMAALTINRALISDGSGFIIVSAVTNTELALLSGATTLELQANKGAVSGYAGLDSSQKLLLTNFPSGTGLQVLRRNTGNTALEFATLSDLEGITSINADTTAAQIIAAGDGLDIVDAGATHTLAVDSSVARNTDNLSFFSATTSLQLIGVISNPTGTGLLVFGTSPTIVTPTIASFVNATHDHQAAAGGGTLLSTSALSDTADIAYLNTANIFIAGNKNTFAHSATTAGLNVAPVAGNPSGQADGDIWLNVSTQQLFARINGADVDLGAGGGGGEANTIASLGGGTVLTAAVPKSGVQLQTVSIATTAPLTHSVTTDLLTFDINDLVNADISATAAIVLTKLQNIATARLLGRQTAASGAIEEISLNATLELVATTTLQRAALTGDVTAAAGSNATVVANVPAGAYAAGSIVDADISATAEINVTKLLDGTPGQFIRTDSAGTGVEWTDDIFTISILIDGGGSVITTGKTGTLTVDFACEVLEWAVIATGASGAIVVDINRSTFAGFPTTSSIAGTELPTITATSDKGENRTLTTWSTIAVGNVIEWEVISVTAITLCSVNLVCRKTG